MHYLSYGVMVSTLDSESSIRAQISVRPCNGELPLVASFFFASISRNILFKPSYFIYTLYLYFLYFQYFESYRLYTHPHPIYSNHPRLDVIVFVNSFFKHCQMEICQKYGLSFRKWLNVNETLTKGDFVRARLFQKIILKSL